MPVEGERIAIQIIEGELTCPPRSIANAVGRALDATLPVFVVECVRVRYQKPQADGAHFVLELKLHVQLNGVTAISDVIRRIGVVFKGELEPKLLSIELNRTLDIPCADNRVSFPEHCRLPTNVVAPTRAQPLLVR